MAMLKETLTVTIIINQQIFPRRLYTHIRYKLTHTESICTNLWLSRQF